MSNDTTIVVPMNGAAAPEDPFAEAPASSAAPRRRRRAPGEVDGTRNDHDAYDTDPALALACVEWLKNRASVYWPEHGPLVIEPTAGGGPFVRAVRQVWGSSKIVATDVRGTPEVEAACKAAGADRFVCLDALQFPVETIAKADLIISNPPFKIADALARHFFLNMKDRATMAFLLSVTFLGSSDRWNLADGLFSVAMPLLCPQIVPRPSFTGDSPKFEAALFVWRKGAIMEHGGIVVPPDPIRWVKPRAERKRRAKP